MTEGKKGSELKSQRRSKEEFSIIVYLKWNHKGVYLLLFDISCKNSPYTSTTAAAVLLHVYQGFYITTNTRSNSTKSSVSWRKGLPRPGSHVSYNKPRSLAIPFYKLHYEFSLLLLHAEMLSSPKTLLLFGYPLLHLVLLFLWGCLTQTVLWSELWIRELSWLLLGDRQWEQVLT